MVVTITLTGLAGRHRVTGTTKSIVESVAAVIWDVAPSTVMAMSVVVVSNPLPVTRATCPSTSVSGETPVTVRSVPSAKNESEFASTPGTSASSVWAPRPSPSVHCARTSPLLSVDPELGVTLPPPDITANNTFSPGTPLPN